MICQISHVVVVHMQGCFRTTEDKEVLIRWLNVRWDWWRCGGAACFTNASLLPTGLAGDPLEEAIREWWQQAH
jgi:hypothetical protein